MQKFMKKVLFIIAHDGFQPMEYSAPKKILESAGIEVVTASDLGGVAVSLIGQEQAKVDVALSEVEVSDYVGLFFIGGAGALEHLDNDQSYEIIRKAAAGGKIFGAICISPRILAKAGVLKNKKATGWDGDNELGAILSSAGAEYIREPVVIDGNLITVDGPSAAEAFGKAVASKLSL